MAYCFSFMYNIALICFGFYDKLECLSATIHKLATSHLYAISTAYEHNTVYDILCMIYPLSLYPNEYLSSHLKVIYIIFNVVRGRLTLITFVFYGSHNVRYNAIILKNECQFCRECQHVDKFLCPNKFNTKKT